MVNNIRKHSFMSDDLLIPNANKIDAGRSNMWSNHVPQILPLVKPEVPKISTGFENQIGSYASSLLVADKKYEIVEIIKKNKFFMMVVLKSGNTYDVIFPNNKHVTETYGYVVNSVFDEKQVGDKIEKGEVIQAPTSFDKDANFMYGVNLKTIFSSHNNMTYEDAIVISKSASEKLTTYVMNNFDISINENDLLLNLYGDQTKYKSFPNVGEKINNKILCCRRRIDNTTALYDLKSDQLTGEGNITNNDAVFYDIETESTIMDIEVFSNKSIEDLSKYEYNHQIVSILKNQNRFYTAVKLVLGQIIKNPKNKYSGDLEFHYHDAISILGEKAKWRDDKVFENIIVRFKTIKEKRMTIGSKMTTRMGSKGIVSEILDDSEMPDGVDAILSPLGVVNRTNISVLFEHHLNFLSLRLEEFMANNINGDVTKVKEEYLKFLKLLSPRQHATTLKHINTLKTLSDEKEYLLTVITGGIHLLQPPFYDNADIHMLLKAYHELSFDISKFKLSNYEEKFVVGDVYYVRLKHHGVSKFSARSTGGTNLHNTPSKNKLFKNKESLFSKTPIRLGEMEINNLLLLDNVEELQRFIKTYSSNDKMRKESIISLAENGFIKRIGTENEKSNIIKVLEEYLKVIGIEIVE